MKNTTEEILASSLLIKDNCVVYNESVYERLINCEHKYRVFFSVDDYDYIEDESLIKLLDVIN